MSENNGAQPRAQQRRGGPFGGPPGMMMPGDKAKDFGGAIKKLIVYMGRYKWTVVFIWVLAAASAVFMIVGPKIMAKATDELIAGLIAQYTGTGGINFNSIGRILLTLCGFYLLSASFMFLQGFVMAGVSMKLTYRLRGELNAKIHRLPFGYFDRVTHGDILSRIANDVDTVGNSLSQSVTQAVSSLTALVGVIIMMFTVSWQLTLIALVSIPLTMAIMVSIVKLSQKHFVNQQRFLGQVNGHVEEMLGAHTVVKAFNGEDASVSAFSEYNDALCDASRKANFLSGLMMPISGFIGNLSYVAICVAGGYFAARGDVTVGGIQAFLQYVRSLMHPISQIASISSVMQQTAAAAERVFEFLGGEEESPDAPDALDIVRSRSGDIDETAVAASGNAAAVEGRVAFNRVRFGYKPDSAVIRGLSLAAERGQKIAIVGPTGAGKTTIVKLLMRFYDVSEGEITLDGRDIRLLKRDGLRRAFGMVLQDTWLFNGTIAENIRYGRLGASDAQVRAAAKTAGADHFIRALPDGYNMILNEEADNISQGQKQLLTIARAVLANPNILILDEATSSVDTRTEVLIQKAMDELMKGRTCFVIAHRLSTIRNADLILVMRDGDIVEQGSHGALLEADGFYASLYNSQFQNRESNAHGA